LDSRPHLNMGNERGEYPSRVGRETRWLVETGAAATANGPGSLRTERLALRQASRLRRKAPAIPGSADRRRRETGVSPLVIQSAATPNEGGTAEGSTFRRGDEGSFVLSGAGAR